MLLFVGLHRHEFLVMNFCFPSSFGRQQSSQSVVSLLKRRKVKSFHYSENLRMIDKNNFVT